MLKQLFIIAFIINATQLGAMTGETSDTKKSVLARAQQKHSAHAQAISSWYGIIKQKLIAVKDSPEGIYQTLEEIFIAAGQEALRDHFVTPRFVADCIIELNIDITQLIFVKISEKSAGGYSLLAKAMALNDTEIIETLKYVLSHPNNFVPSR